MVEIFVMKLIPVIETQVINMITSLKRKNASGHDGISKKILKLHVNAISKPFAYMCNSSLISRVYPDRC
jgi:hypothetical protein